MRFIRRASFLFRSTSSGRIYPSSSPDALRREENNGSPCLGASIVGVDLIEFVGMKRNRRTSPPAQLELVASGERSPRGGETTTKDERRPDFAPTGETMESNAEV